MEIIARLHLELSFVALLLFLEYGAYFGDVLLSFMANYIKNTNKYIIEHNGTFYVMGNLAVVI